MSSTLLRRAVTSTLVVLSLLLALLVGQCGRAGQVERQLGPRAGRVHVLSAGAARSREAEVELRHRQRRRRAYLDDVTVCHCFTPARWMRVNRAISALSGPRLSDPGVSAILEAF